MDKFDLELKITETLNFIDRLNDISYGVLELDLSKDDTVNAIDGIAVLLKLHTEKLFDIFKEVFELDGGKNDKKII